MKKNLTWIVDTYILDSITTRGNICKSIEDNGFNLYTTRYVPFADNQDYNNLNETDPVVLYGTVGYIQKCKIPFTPGAFGITKNTDCNVYYNYIPNNWMLNSDFLMVPFGVFKNDTHRFFNILGNKIFIRPISGRKTFAGFVLSDKNYEFELNSSMQLTSVTEETICLISSSKPIDAEYRFVVGNNKIIDGSCYRYNNILDIRHDFSGEAYDLANKVAKLNWQVDNVYTVDVADTPCGPKIVELNGFSCAGLYACDRDLIVKEVSKIALDEFYG